MARSRKSIIDHLVQMGWNKSLASSAYYLWGVNAIDILKQDPYSALFLNPQLKWVEMDRVARGLGITDNSLERICGSIRYSLFSSIGDGHVFLPHFELQKRVSRLTVIHDQTSWQTAMSTMLQNREILFRNTEPPDQTPVYLRNLYQAENTIATLLSHLHASASNMAMQPPTSLEMNEVEQHMNIHLAPSQYEAIIASLTHKLVVITGGPGTGKTTIIRGVLRLWRKRGARIKLAAPTGRAAKRLTESTGKHALTIHRLLEYSPDSLSFQRNSNRPLKVDLMVVDESSMIDTELMASLLQALPSSCHLLLVGDVDQLPAVGPGFVLHDLIESGCLCTIKLTQIFRQEQGSLISLNAQRINQGEMPQLESGGIEKGQDFFFIQRSTPQGAQEAILEMVTDRIPRQFGFDPKQEIQVLCPMIKRDVGVESMNALLQNKLNFAENRFQGPFYSLSPGDKIMQTKNDYTKDVFNGDIGYVQEINVDEDSIVINFEGKEIPYTKFELDNTSLAYAMTVHKAQGSEYPAVVVPLVMQHFPMLQRNLLYTAVSRGKKLVILVGDPRALELAVRNNKIRARYTGLLQQMREKFSSEIREALNID